MRFLLLFTISIILNINNVYSFERKFQLFSFEIPFHSQWEERSSSSNSMSFVRSLDGTPFSTFALSAHELPAYEHPFVLDELVTEISDSFKRTNDQDSKNIMTSHYTRKYDKLGIDCVEYDKEWENFSSSIAPDEKLVMHEHGLMCIHPKHNNRLIQINYSTRGADKIDNKSVVEEGERFINSLRALKFK